MSDQIDRQMDEIIAAAGWTSESCYQLAREYIASENLCSGFLAFLRRQRDTENLCACLTCGQACAPDPDGSEGVYVHVTDEGEPLREIDADHAPVPEVGSYGLGLAYEACPPGEEE